MKRRTSSCEFYDELNTRLWLNIPTFIRWLFAGEDPAGPDLDLGTTSSSSK